MGIIESWFIFWLLFGMKVSLSWCGSVGLVVVKCGCGSYKIGIGYWVIMGVVLYS